MNIEYYINGFNNYINSDGQDGGSLDNNNLSDKIINMVNKYIKLDNAYRIKHKELMVLYNEYEKLYKKCKRDDDKNYYSNKINKIINDLKYNDECMYNRRLQVINNIKKDDEINYNDKEVLAKKIVVAYRLPPVKEYRPIQTPPIYKMEKTRVDGVSHDEVDKAYIRKHNELIHVFKAYKKLYNKVGDYKSNLDKYQNLKINSKITKEQMEKMLDDQDFMMKSINDMQDKLISDDILRVEDKIPFEHVIGNYKNIGYFNDNVKQQIGDVIHNKKKITEKQKDEIDKILRTENDDLRDDGIRNLILFRNK